MKKKPAIAEKAPVKETALVPSAEAPVVVINKLTKAQESLLETLRDPACQFLDVSKICKLANITRATYYNAFKDQNFLRAYDSEMQAYRSMNEFQIMHTVVQRAKEGKNHHFTQMFLKMQGRLDEKASKPAQINVVFNVERPPIKIEKVIDGEAETVVD
jgi:hypothetical protein